MKGAGFRRQFLGLALGLLIACGCGTRAAEANPPVDVALVFAIDASGSISDAELGLQKAAIAAAVLAPEVLDAVRTGRHQRIALSFLLWGDAGQPSQAGAWHVVENADDAAGFGIAIMREPRLIAGDTNIGTGIGDALMLLERLPFEAARLVIDVSGDGRESSVPARQGKRNSAPRISPSAAVQLARVKNVTINGLAILDTDKELDQWYRKNIATGLGSFVISVEHMGDFTTAMKRKVLRELGPAAVAGALDRAHFGDFGNEVAQQVFDAVLERGG